MPCISAARVGSAMQYDFHLEKILSCLANHIAITLHKAEYTLLKTPSILLLIPQYYYSYRYSYRY